MDKAQKTSLIINIITIIITIVGCILCFGEIYIIPTKPLDHGIRLLKFFTVQSNILAGITSLIYIIFLQKQNKTGKQIPSFVHTLRLIATTSLIITFLVVALFLGFIVEEGYFSLYVNANFFFHFLTPILTFISFSFFEKTSSFNFKNVFWGISHLILYSIFYLTVVLTHIQNGKVPLYYDWYAFAQLGIGIAFVCAFIILSLGFLVSFLLYKLKNKNSIK